MSKADTQSSKYLGNQSKSSKYLGQIEKTYQSFFDAPKTMLMVSRETNIERASICRYCAKFRKDNELYFICFGLCPISKNRAGFYTTNPRIFKELTDKSN